MEDSGGDPIAGEVSGNQVNIATAQVDISDVPAGAILRISKIGPTHVLALLQPCSAEAVYASLLGCENTYHT